jgi:hypothetical protein
MNERFTEKYLEYATEFTDCPQVFLMWGALLAISSSLSRDVHVEIGSWNIAPHIWPVLIGKSSSHKSTALSITEDLIESVDVDRLAPHEFSQEAILKALSERSSRLFIFDEAKSFFDSMGKKYNEGLKSLFTTLYRKPNYTRTTLKHGTLSIRQAYLTIGMASTPEWLRESLTNAEDSAMSGFLARFLMIPYTGKGSTPIPMPPPHDLLKFGALKDQLRAFQRISRPYRYSLESLAAFKEWFQQTTERENAALPVLGPFFEHFKNEAIHKLSVLFAIDRGEETISLEAFKEARISLSFVEEQLPALVSDLTDSKFDRERLRIMAIVKSHRVIDRTSLSRLSRITGRRLTDHLSGLFQDDLIRTIKRETSGRYVQEVTWVGELHE